MVEAHMPHFKPAQSASAFLQLTETFFEKRTKKKKPGLRSRRTASAVAYSNQKCEIPPAPYNEPHTSAGTVVPGMLQACTLYQKHIKAIFTSEHSFLISL